MTPTVNRDDLIQTLRPLDGWEILARGVKALEVNDLESASYIYDYLTTRKRERFAKYFKTMIVNEFNTYPIEFSNLGARDSEEV